MKILIIEDESRIARRIERMIRSIFNDKLSKLNVVDNLENGLKFIKDNEIDLLFLDLNLNGKDGFEVLESVVSEPFQTIIISAYKEKAIRAFEYGVLDFVPKPFDQDRLAKACNRISTKSITEPGIKFLAIKKKGRQMLIGIDQIKYIKGAGIYTELHLKNGATEIHNKTLDGLHLLLPDSFERIHKSYIAEMTNAKEIKVEPGSKYSLVLKTEEELPIGRTRYKKIKEQWFS